MFPKDKEAITKQRNFIYWFKCSKTECDDDFIGELSRSFEERYKEHLKEPSPIIEHQNITCHSTTVKNSRIISREGQNMARAIKETIYIRVNNPTLNRNMDMYNLLHIWGKVLFVHFRAKNKINDLSTTRPVP